MFARRRQPTSSLFPAALGTKGTPNLASRPGNPRWSRLALGGTVQRIIDPAQRPYAGAKASPAAPPAKAPRTPEQFEADAPYTVRNFHPSTGSGFFDAVYVDGKFHAVVRVEFRFLPNYYPQFAKYSKAELEWPRNGLKTPGSPQNQFKAQYLSQIGAFWDQKITLHCVRPGWDQVKAQVSVSFIDVANNPLAELDTFGDLKSPHYIVEVTRVPPKAPEQLQSETVPPYGNDPGVQRLSSDAFTMKTKSAGTRQRTGIHESGHIFGLGDSYVDPKAPGRKEASHSRAAEYELGEKVLLRDDDRLMSVGERVSLSDGVTFVEAIRAATNMRGWSLRPQSPWLQPPPKDYDDGVPPRETVA